MEMAYKKNDIGRVVDTFSSPSQRKDERERTALNDHPQIVYCLGVVLCFLGASSLTLGTITLMMSGRRPSEHHMTAKYHPPDLLTYCAQGIWCGAIMMFSGAIGLRTKASHHGTLYSESAKWGVATTLACIATFSLSCIAAYSYTYPLWRVDFISLHAVIATISFAGVPISIAQVIFSNHANNSTFWVPVYTKNTEHDVQSTAVAIARLADEGRFNRFVVIGIIEMIAGVISLVVNFITVARMIRNDDSASIAFGYTCEGIWGGAFLIQTGIFGISLKFCQSVRVINGNMATSLLTFATSLSVGVLSVIAFMTVHSSLSVLHIVIASLGFTAMILCTVHTTLSYLVLCQIHNY